MRIHAADLYSLHNCAYTQIAEAIDRFSPRPLEDKQELWARICFNMHITNVDDHLQNHGFLHVERGHVSDQGGFQPVLSPKGQLQHVLVPFVKAHVHTVDLAARRLDSNWPVEL